MHITPYEKFDKTLYFIAPKNKEKWYSHKYFKDGEIDQIVPVWEICFDSWKDSSFKIELLNDGDDLDDAIQTYDPEMERVFKKIPLIYKIDYVKYLLIGKRGGGYADMDMELNCDFKNMLHKNRVYLVQNHKDSLQNSLMFSHKPGGYWDIVISNVREKIIGGVDDILDAVEKYARRKEIKSVDTKDIYLEVTNQHIGSFQMKKALKEYEQIKDRQKVVIMPSTLFNNSVYHHFKFTTHWVTGLWRRHGRVFGPDGRRILDEFLISRSK